MINKELYSSIFKRKSFHLFRNIGNKNISLQELKEIEDAYHHFSSLCPNIKTSIKIVPAEMTRCKRGEEYCIFLYSERKENYLQNIGYIGEQLDLFLVQKNIGTLWFGIGKTEELKYEDLDFVIMIAIAKIDDENKFRKDMFQSQRKPIEEMWIGKPINGVTDIVRFAPSACNTQPWLVEHDNNMLYIYRYKEEGKKGIMPKNKVSFYNQIDVGIFLCFLDLCLLNERISFDVELRCDAGLDKEKTLFAIYKL